jgi:hypothetical protein
LIGVFLAVVFLSQEFQAGSRIRLILMQGGSRPTPAH